MDPRGRLKDTVGSFWRLSQVGPQAAKEMRLMIHQFRSPVPEEMGLVGWLQQRLEEIRLPPRASTQLVP